MLGPDFISDQFVVETSDHARLRVALAMNNYFTVGSTFLCSIHVNRVLSDPSFYKETQEGGGGGGA